MNGGRRMADGGGRQTVGCCGVASAYSLQPTAYGAGRRRLLTRAQKKAAAITLGLASGIGLLGWWGSSALTPTDNDATRNEAMNRHIRSVMPKKTVPLSDLRVEVEN